MDAFNFFLFPSLTALSDDCLELEHLIYLGSERCNLFLESECPLLIGLLFSLRSYWNSVNYSAAAAATTGRGLVFCLSWMDAHPIPSCAAIRIKSIAFQMLGICTATSCICLSYRTGFVSGLKHQPASIGFRRNWLVFCCTTLQPLTHKTSKTPLLSFSYIVVVVCGGGSPGSEHLSIV